MNLINWDSCHSPERSHENITHKNIILKKELKFNIKNIYLVQKPVVKKAYKYTKNVEDIHNVNPTVSIIILNVKF